MDHCNGLPTITKIESPLGTDKNGYEDKRYCPNSYTYVIRMILYLEYNTRPDIYFYFNQCSWFSHNTKESHDTDVKRIYHYLQGTKDKGLVFNTPNKLVVDCYFEAYFGLWGHENPQDPICARSRTGFVVKFTNCTILWV